MRHLSPLHSSRKTVGDPAFDGLLGLACIVLEGFRARGFCSWPGMNHFGFGFARCLGLEIGRVN